MQALLDKYEYYKTSSEDVETFLPIDMFVMEEEYTIGLKKGEFVTSTIYGIMTRKGTHLSRYILHPYGIPELSSYCFVASALRELIKIADDIKNHYSLTEPEW